jgi:GTP pyrophosphokinase
MEMFQDQVFCFSPKGEVFGFPRGATVIDFAYAVHSEVGDHCVGSKINGRMVPLRTALENGDQIEILTSKAQTPSPDWERMIVTGKARSHIRRFIHQEQRRQYVSLGKEIVEKAFRSDHREFTRKAIRAVSKKFGGRSADDVFAKVGEGLYSGADIVQSIFTDSEDGEVKFPKPKRRRKVNGKSEAIEIKGLIPGMAMHLAKCCYPLPGDRIVGIVTTGKGITVHTMDCDTLQNFADTPERWLAVTWSADDSAAAQQISRLHIILNNETGSLGELATLIGRHESNISNLKITHRNTDFFDLTVDIEVSGVRHLSEVVAALRATPSVNRVERSQH